MVIKKDGIKNCIHDNKWELKLCCSKLAEDFSISLVLQEGDRSTFGYIHQKFYPEEKREIINIFSPDWN